MRDRGQLSVTLLEAGIAAVLVLSVAALVVFAGGSGGGAQETRLDRYATDLGRVLTDPSGGAPTLATLVGSPAAFQRVDGALAREAVETLPAGVFYRVDTAYGSLGSPRPENAVMGSARVHTVNGTVTIWVWTP